ncbi:hypothetical protein G7Y89_g3660 [Cudoniella acicularis]|uniref:SAM domain-containing protein n=1 Tax=Cudoniella acicularis TaxID=354080 RepID=A0A8H4RSA3_9HELO|nr:hypothetical protein G7Y89_g3660 [Cudoniella acicularis]
MPSELEQVLSNLGIEQYLSLFEDAGYGDWDQVCEMSKSDLEELDMKVGHRRKLQREIARKWGWPDSKPLPSEAELRALKWAS